MAFQAYAKGDRATADTAFDAARIFFERFPNRRKCNLIEGTTDGKFFTVVYGKGAGRSFKDVTKKTAENLPKGE